MDPKISVLMTTYNGASFIREGLDSVLSQTFQNFELLVVDDCSTDGTADILASYSDPRLRVLRPERNMGVVRARNLGFSACAGAYIAPLDHDDLAIPERLATESGFLDDNPEIALVASRVQVFGPNWGMPGYYAERTTPMLMRWLLHIINPLVYSSVMIRSDVVHRLGAYMRPEYQYTDDFDLYHRILPIADIAYLDRVLTHYRVHAGNTTHSKASQMSANAVAILAASYRELLENDAERAASLIWRHLGAQSAPRTLDGLVELGKFLDMLLTRFISQYQPSPSDRTLIAATTGWMWWQSVAGTARRGNPQAIALRRASPLLHRAFRPSWSELATTLAVACARHRHQTVD